MKVAAAPVHCGDVTRLFPVHTAVEAAGIVCIALPRLCNCLALSISGESGEVIAEVRMRDERSGADALGGCRVGEIIACVNPSRRWS